MERPSYWDSPFKYKVSGKVVGCEGLELSSRKLLNEVIRCGYRYLRILELDKNALRVALSLACLEIRSRNEEAINFTQNRIYLLKNWFSTLVSDDWKYISNHRLYTCINTWKFENLDSREITSLPEIKKVIYMAPHFNHHWKLTICSSQDPFAYKWEFTTPDELVFC